MMVQSSETESITATSLSPMESLSSSLLGSEIGRGIRDLLDLLVLLLLASLPGVVGVVGELDTQELP